MKKIICALSLCMIVCIGSVFSQQKTEQSKNGEKTNGVKIHQEKNAKTSTQVKNKNDKPVAQSINAIPPAPIVAEAKKFCDIFKTYEEPSQFYSVPAHETKEVKGIAGTIILVNPDDLATLSNQSVDGSIDVELKELVNKQQLLKTNAQTVCNGKQLVSGGAYYINLKSQGQPVKLKPGRALSVQFPKFTDTPMALFNGYRDSLGQMQWKQRNQNFKPNGPAQAWRDTRNVKIESEGDVLIIDSVRTRKPQKQTEQEKQKTEAYTKLYAAMEIQNLGWINCDRFYNVPDKTTLSVKLTNSQEIVYASIYLIFDDINSIVQTHYGNTQNEISNPGFENVPVGAKARVVAFSLNGNKMMGYTTPIIIKKDDTISLSLKEISEEELKTMLNTN